MARTDPAAVPLFRRLAAAPQEVAQLLAASEAATAKSKAAKKRKVQDTSTRKVQDTSTRKVQDPSTRKVQDTSKRSKMSAETMARVAESYERPHGCPTCGRAFARKAKLKRHMGTHLGKRPNICQRCGKGFARCENLTSHMRLHDKFSLA